MLIQSVSAPSAMSTFGATESQRLKQPMPANSILAAYLLQNSAPGSRFHGHWPRYNHFAVHNLIGYKNAHLFFPIQSENQGLALKLWISFTVSFLGRHTYFSYIVCLPEKLMCKLNFQAQKETGPKGGKKNTILIKLHTILQFTIGTEGRSCVLEMQTVKSLSWL